MSYYLTIVATSRNDNHGGDLLLRTSTFVKGIFEQAKKWNLPIELVLVDWNPPEDKPFLHEVLPAPNSNDLVDVKYVIVPPEVHNKYKNSESIPLYQMIAKNVGIRRASGEFILCTNIDILFSDICFQILSQKRLLKNHYYRANRCDIPSDVMKLREIAEQLKFAENNIIKRLGKVQGHETLSLPRFVYYFPRVAKMLNAFVLKVWKVTHKKQFAHFTIDFDACGDFTLMSREDWLDIEGYPELDMYSIHIDSMGLWAAIARGKKQIIFPYKAPVYHIYHEDGWESDDAIRTIRFLQNKPSLDYSIVNKGGMQLVEKQQTWGLNESNWGMNDIELPIVVKSRVE